MPIAITEKMVGVWAHEVGGGGKKRERGLIVRELLKTKQ